MIHTKTIWEIDRNRFFEFCHEVSKGPEPAARNMAQVPQIISERYAEKGMFTVLFDEDKIIGCSGVYTSAFSPDVAILGSRSWLLKDYRNKSLVRDVLLPPQRQWALEMGRKVGALTFNWYNRNLRELFLRPIVKRTPRREHMLFSKNINVIDYPVLIQAVPQWVLYEKFTEWDFDWSTIAAPGYPSA
jgi:hypothetical protein